MSGTLAPARTATPTMARPIGTMPETVGRSDRSLVDIITTSAGPVLSAPSTLAREPPPTVTAMPVLAVYWAARDWSPAVAEAGASTARGAASAGAPRSASVKTRLNRRGIHMQDIDQIFEVALDGLFHVAAFGDHGSIKVQGDPAPVIFLDQKRLNGRKVHAIGVRMVDVAAEISEPAMATGFGARSGHGHHLVAAQVGGCVLVMDLGHARPIVLHDLQRVHAAKRQVRGVGGEPDITRIGQLHQPAGLMLVLDQRADMGMGRQLDAELDGFHADGVQRIGADLDLVVADVIPRRTPAIVHLEMVAVAERPD